MKWKMLFTWLVLIIFSSQWALAHDDKDCNFDATTNVCSYSDSDTCHKAMDQFKSAPGKDQVVDRASQVASFCYMMQADDKACVATIPIATLYTVFAAICVVACIPTPYTKAFEIACTVGSLAASLSDFVAGMAVSHSGEDFSRQAAGMISKDYGFATGAAGLLAQGVIGMAELGYTIGGFAASAAEQTGSAATKAAGKGGSKGSCYSAAIDAILAGIHFYDYHQIMSSAKDQCNNMVTLKMPSALGQTQAASSFSNQDSPPPPTASARGAAGESLKKKVDNMANSGQLANSFATGEFRKTHDNFSPENFQKGLDALKEHFGVTPGDLAASAATDGVGATLSKLMDNSPEGNAMKEMLNKLDKDTQAFLKSNKNEMAFNSSPSGGGGEHKASGGGLGDLSSLFGGGRGPAAGGAPNAGASAIKFGGFSNDIWHAGTNKTIFEIVSDKTHSVSERVAY